MDDKSLISDDGQISAVGICRYAEAMALNTVDKLPKNLYEYVQDHPEVLSKVLRHYLLIKGNKTLLAQLSGVTPSMSDQKQGNKLSPEAYSQLLAILKDQFNPHPILERELSDVLMSDSLININSPKDDHICFGDLRFDIGIQSNDANFRVTIRDNQNEIIERTQYPIDKTSLSIDLSKHQTGLYYWYINVGDEGDFKAGRFYICQEDFLKAQGL